VKKSYLRLKADFLLLSVAVIWGSAFVVQRIAGQHMGFFVFNGLRFLLGALILTPFAVSNWHFPRLNTPHAGRAFLRKAGLPLAAGLVLFVASSLQQAGLQHTTAGNASFFTSLYVVIIPFFLSFIWKQRVRQQVWAAAAVAVTGAALLSTGGVRLTLAPGDSLELLGAFFWALHVIIVGRAMRRLQVLRFSVAQYLVAGLLNLLAGLLLYSNPFRGIDDAWWTILYIGVLSTAVGYTLQAAGQRYAPPSDAAILLSMEAVFGALFGWMFLGELLSMIQMVGCLLIFSGVIIAQWKQMPDTIGGQ
jgi:drug/metabolite transporter (DMT)-like permease